MQFIHALRRMSLMTGLAATEHGIMIYYCRTPGKDRMTVVAHIVTTYMTAIFSRSKLTIVTMLTLSWRTFEYAALVALFAGGRGMASIEWKTGIKMIEIGIECDSMILCRTKQHKK
jgi:hypothetical protein